MNDIEIVKSVQDGNKNDFIKLYDKYLKKIYDFIFYKVGDKNTAEDLTSELFIKIYESINKFDITKNTAFSSWIYTIANNLVIDYYRSQKETISDEIVGDKTFSMDMLGDIQNRDKIKEVLNYLDSLEPIQKDIFMMRIWNDMSYNEISEIVGKSVDNCKQIFSRTMKKVVANVSVSSLISFIVLIK